MGKSRKDAVGGHANRDCEIGYCTGWTQSFRRFAKDRANRMLRRQFKAAHKAAILEYEADYQEWLDWQEAEDEALDDEYVRYLNDSEYEDDLDCYPEYDGYYEPKRQVKSFVYERDIDNPSLGNEFEYAEDPYWY